MNFTLDRQVRTGTLLFTRQDMRHTALLAVPAVLAFIAVLLYAGYQIYATNQELATDQQQLAALSSVRAPLVDAQAAADRAASTISILENHRMTALEPLERLAFLNQHLPNAVRLNSVTVSDNGLAITGDTVHPGDIIAAEHQLSALKVSNISLTAKAEVYTWTGSFK